MRTRPEPHGCGAEPSPHIHASTELDEPLTTNSENPSEPHDYTMRSIARPDRRDERARHDSLVEKAGHDSFPASDPPGWWAGPAVSTTQESGAP